MIRAGTFPAFSDVRRSVIVAFAAVLAAMPAAGASSPARAELLSLGQPANVGDTKIAATAYRASGKYDRDLGRINAAAGAWIALRAPRVSRPAVVFDIDDTLLTNWEVIKADDFGRGLRRPLLHAAGGTVRLGGVGPARQDASDSADRRGVSEGPRAGRRGVLHQRAQTRPSALQPSGTCASWGSATTQG